MDCSSVSNPVRRGFCDANRDVDVPKPVLRRHIEQTKCCEIVARALMKRIQYYSPQQFSADIHEDVDWLSTVRRSAERAMTLIADFSICFHAVYWQHLEFFNGGLPSRSDDTSAFEFCDFDNALLKVCVHHYNASLQSTSVWNPASFESYLQEIASKTLPSEIWRYSRPYKYQGVPTPEFFMFHSRKYMRKCHTHLVRRMVTKKVCEGRLPSELVAMIGEFAMPEYEIRSAKDWYGKIIPA